MIPFLDLVTPHVELEEELVAIFRDCIRKAHFHRRAHGREFERDFAEFCEPNIASASTAAPTRCASP